MTDQKILEFLNFYRKYFVRHKIQIQRLSVENYNKPNLSKLSKQKLLEHAHWMTYQIEEFIFTDRREKAIHWLGFIQGVLYAKNIV